jgi:hypothetical protein
LPEWRNSVRRTARGSPVNNRKKQARGYNPAPAASVRNVRDGPASRVNRLAVSSPATKVCIFIVPINEKQ